MQQRRSQLICLTDMKAHPGLNLHSRLNTSVPKLLVARFSALDDLRFALLTTSGTSRRSASQNPAYLLRICVMESEPVVPSPAKHAANRSQRKHAEQAIERS
jgi:hypothetical protein